MRFRPTALQAKILEILRKHRGGLTISEIRSKLPKALGPQSELGKRIRELRTHYTISCTTGRYRFSGSRKKRLDSSAVGLKLRAQVLHRAGQRCEQCGARVKEDGVRLHVDHRIPRSWGGRTIDENLWALCEDCNLGKKHFFASLDQRLMKRLMRHSSVHVRIGELLKAKRGKPVPANMIHLVANQHDWMKRTRELRYLGWAFKTLRTRTSSGRQESQYVLTTFKKWPTDPTRVIRAFESTRLKRNSGRRGNRPA